MRSLPRLTRIRQTAPLRTMLLAAVASCTWLVAGCGGDDEAAKAPEEDGPEMSLKASGMPVAPPPRAAKKQRERRADPTPVRRSKPPGVPLQELPEDQFAVVGNADAYRIADTQHEPGDLFVTAAPAAGAGSRQFTTQPVAANRKPPAGAGVPLPPGFRPLASAGYDDRGWPRRIVCLKDDSIMALVPAGVFTRGAEEGPEASQPPHRVHLESYYIDIHEVTHGQYERFRRDLRERRERAPIPLENSSDPSYPATGVRWGEALQYARWAGKSLPTDAEWEKAARGGDGFTYPWGNGKPIWHIPRQPEQINAVGTFRGDRSPYGVIDLAGNAREWCQDWYSAVAYDMALKQAGASTLYNPQGPPAPVGSEDRTVRVVRGGVDGWEAWRRDGVSMGTRSPTIGFRCVLRPGADQPTTDSEPATPKPAGF